MEKLKDEINLSEEIRKSIKSKIEECKKEKSCRKSCLTFKLSQKQKRHSTKAREERP